MSYLEIEQTIKELERQGKFDQHVAPIDFEHAEIVDENFDYFHKSFKDKFKRFFQKIFVVNPYSFFKNNVENKVKVFGRENLKNLGACIVTCNHTNMCDCLAVKKALKTRKVKITGAPFNNRNSFFGKMMNVGGFMPMGSNIKGTRNFQNALQVFLKNGFKIVFYPEQAMWPGYEKPRPLKPGAFHYAAKFNVPVLPIFITYRHTNKTRKDGTPIKFMNVHILKPINSDKQNEREKAQDLMMQNEILWKKCYEQNCEKNFKEKLC